MEITKNEKEILARILRERAWADLQFICETKVLANKSAAEACERAMLMFRRADEISRAL